MKSLIAGWIGIALAFAVSDLIWLSFVAKGFYQSELGALRAETVRVLPAAAFYLIMVTGILVFVVLPASETGNLGGVMLVGAFFGFVSYATYDLTNLATLRQWPVALTLVDLAWGAFLTMVASASGYLLMSFAGKN